MTRAWTPARMAAAAAIAPRWPRSAASAGTLRRRWPGQRAELLQAAHGPDPGVRMRQHAVECLRAAGVDPGQQVPCGRQVQVARAGQGGRGGRLINAAQQCPAHAALGFIQLRDGARRRPNPAASARKSSHRNGQGGAGRRAVRGRPAGPAADVADQFEQVGAVDGRIVEAVRAPVPVGVKAAAATGHHRARLAGLAQPGEPLLAGADARMLRDHVQAVGEDIRTRWPGRRRTRSSANRPARSCHRSRSPPGRWGRARVPRSGCRRRRWSR